MRGTALGGQLYTAELTNKADSLVRRAEFFKPPA
jgi:hypothetical protein